MSSPLIPAYYNPPTSIFPAYYAPPSPPKPPKNNHHSGSLTVVLLVGFFSFFAIAAGVALFLFCRRRRRREDVEDQRETELSSQARNNRPAVVPGSTQPAAVVPSSSQPATVPSRSGLGPIEEGRIDEITEDHRSSFLLEARGVSEADIDALPQPYYNARDMTDHVCGICKKHFVPNNHLLMLEPCHHPVHIRCGRTYLGMCRVCPTCRVEVIPIQS